MDTISTFDSMRIITICALTALIFSCSAGKESNVPKKDSKITAKASATVKKLTIHFHLYRPYCGGAAPTPDMEDLRRKGENFAGQKIIFIHLETQKESDYTTDENGDIEVNLAFGNYAIFSKGKRTPKQIEEWKSKNWEFNPECVAKYLKESDHKLEVNNKTTDQTFRVSKRCFYEGPIPCVINSQDPPP